MKWVLFTGTWRLTNKEVENDVRHAVRVILARGDGVVTGGATGVDYFAMTEALAIDPTGKSLKVFIPTDLPNYLRDYRENWCLAPIMLHHIAELERCLIQLQATKPEHLYELPYPGEITQWHYNLRHNDEGAHSNQTI